MLKSRSLVPLLALALPAACSNGEPAPAAAVEVGVLDEGLSASHARLEGVAPAHLITDDGGYSDVRFAEMMAPHHVHAIAMARVELEAGTDPDLRQMAQKMIDEQTKEIEELAMLKRELVGDDRLPREMHPHQMMQGGIPMPDELRRGTSVDLAFLDGMLPHHAGGIRMGNVVLRHSEYAKAVEIARRTIDAQARDIGELERIRAERYADVHHGFPHAATGR